MFNLFDADGNGTIDMDEIKVLMKKLGFEPNEEKVRPCQRWELPRTGAKCGHLPNMGAVLR